MSDFFVVVELATTSDEQGVYVSKDSAELIELAWRLLDANTLEERARDSVLVRPTNTPITEHCTSLTALTWEHVRAAGTFKDAISKFDAFVQEHISKKEFTFVTLNSWGLRVQLPREARDKGVVLPPYLQHARVFDLKKEYIKWQAHHPETLSYSASNLSSLLTALEVEVSMIMPGCAEQIEIIHAILKALTKKSQPSSEHPDVLTRPFDARADVRAFLAERSKVLHMSNLPNDTTQSELESWFTQFGGRPIAFWTMKTPDQHKPTGSGFAVFNSHEEAAESLAMNGRALNDRAVEVQPSSARVLDRAQEILTTFPASKNRPRPGDWTCPSCGFSNFQRRTACFRCLFPASSAAVVQDTLHTNNNNNNNHQHNHTHNHNNQGNFNQSHQHQNHQLHQPHQQHQHQHQHQNINQSMNQTQNQNNHHNQNMHGQNNHGHNHQNNQRSSVPFRAGDWKCVNEGCSYHNFAKNICCLRCGAPRQSAPAQGQPQGQPQVQAPVQGQGQFFYQKEEDNYIQVKE